jgi:hypothetical protein
MVDFVKNGGETVDVKKRRNDERRSTSGSQICYTVMELGYGTSDGSDKDRKLCLRY